MKKKKTKMKETKFNEGFNIKIFTLVTSVLILISYGIFNARNIILGPSIEIFEPAENFETDNSILLIKGRVRNMTSLTLYGRSISVDTEGIFQEKILLSAGLNNIEIRAKDRFQNETRKTLKVYYRAREPASIEPKASSSADIIEEN